MGPPSAVSQTRAPLHISPVHPAHLQIAGHVISEDGKKKVALKGKWNSFLDMTHCNEEGEPLAGAETVRLWEVSACQGILQLCSSCATVEQHRQEGQAPHRGKKTFRLGEVGACLCLALGASFGGREWPGKGRRCVLVKEAECQLCNLKQLKVA